MSIQHKNIDVEYKAALEDGSFVALASVFNNVDRVGDRMKPGSFKSTLRKWRASGKMLPVILSHNWDDIEAHIGYADPKNVKETSDGLQVKAHLDLNENETARHVHRLMKRGQLTAMSFGYTVPADGQEMDDKGVNEVTEVDLHEVGPTLVGANPEANVQAVKSALQAEAEEEKTEDETPDDSPEDDKTSKSEESEATADDNTDVEDGKDEDPPGKSSPQDDLKQRSRDLALEVLSDGMSLREPSEAPPEPRREVPDRTELKRRSREHVLHILSQGAVDDTQ